MRLPETLKGLRPLQSTAAEVLDEMLTNIHFPIRHSVTLYGFHPSKEFFALRRSESALLFKEIDVKAKDEVRNSLDVFKIKSLSDVVGTRTEKDVIVNTLESIIQSFVSETQMVAFFSAWHSKAEYLVALVIMLNASKFEQHFTLPSWKNEFLEPPSSLPSAVIDVVLDLNQAKAC